MNESFRNDEGDDGNVVFPLFQTPSPYLVMKNRADRLARFCAMSLERPVPLVVIEWEVELIEKALDSIREMKTKRVE